MCTFIIPVLISRNRNLVKKFSDLFVLDVPRDDVLLVEALLVDEGHGEVELLGQDARPPRAALVRGADHGLLPVRDILLDPPDMTMIVSLCSLPKPYFLTPAFREKLQIVVSLSKF